MVHFITAQVFDHEINFTIVDELSLNIAVGGFCFSLYLHTVDDWYVRFVCVCECMCAADMFHGL